MFRFENVVRKREKSWVTLLDVDPDTVSRWNGIFNSSRMDYTSARLNTRFSIHADKDMERLIHIVNNVLHNIIHQFSKPYVFILADKLGISHRFIGPSEVLAGLERQNIGAGTPFNLEFSGINAISVAMEMKCMALLHGKDHSLDCFSHWTCICCPIKVDQEVIGYLDLSFHYQTDVEFAIALMTNIIRDTERQIKYPEQHISKTTFLKKCNEYGLTNKEKEVAYYWFNGTPRLQIAKLLHLSEDTIKTHIKNISCKTDVRGRACFRNKFL